jgi:hypothetical protein
MTQKRSRLPGWMPGGTFARGAPYVHIPFHIPPVFALSPTQAGDYRREVEASHG